MFKIVVIIVMIVIMVVMIITIVVIVAVGLVVGHGGAPHEGGRDEGPAAQQHDSQHLGTDGESRSHGLYISGQAGVRRAGSAHEHSGARIYGVLTYVSEFFRVLFFYTVLVIKRNMY